MECTGAKGSRVYLGEKKKGISAKRLPRGKIFVMLIDVSLHDLSLRPAASSCNEVDWSTMEENDTLSDCGERPRSS